MDIKFSFITNNNQFKKRQQECKVENCPNKIVCKKFTCNYCKKYGHGKSCCYKLLKKKQLKNCNSLVSKTLKNHNVLQTNSNDLSQEQIQNFNSMLVKKRKNYPIQVSKTNNYYASYETNVYKQNHHTKVVMSISEQIIVRYEKK